ncbi:TPA: hypothetical protein R8G83_001504 [Citrobacter youngae]|nr:hypothetical protein [Citrobacter youngae]HEF0089913.1 hypothetical protein [Citrobacter youngae]
MGKIMKKLKVTIAHLEEYCDGIIQGTTVNFQVSQNDRVLAEDSLSGKATHPFSKMYDVNATDDAIDVTHDRPDLSWLTITVELVE